ncbi:MAG: efflux RND transporter periplasmic adaptor subunit [Gemmatimonadetes bacterium]|nr:efflux RND transporter periplasmic adaptor subunit [Gemmatimonadota bacterium]
MPVAVQRAELGAASSYYTTTATLEATSRAEILSRTTGVVRELLREEGDRVRAGDLLLRLEDDEARLRVQQAEANHALAQAEFNRRQKMLEGGLLSAEEFETTESNLAVRESELGLARVALEYTQVRAPFAGNVVLRHVDIGASVNPGSPLYELMDVTPLLAKVYIPAKRMGFVVEGQDMEIRLDSSDEPLRGVVRLVSPIVDSSTGTVKVTAEIKNYPAGTRPGDFAEVRIVTDRHEDAILVPSLALFEEQGENILYVVEDGKAVRRVVSPGFVDGDVTEIETGLEEGEVVVVKGQRQLKDGGAVEIMEGPADLITEPVADAADAKKPDQDAS